MSHFESTVNTAIHANANRQQEDRKNSITAGVGDDCQANRRTELTDCVENLSRNCNATLVSRD